jgi:tetratricopeptide (TPR) repeat protein
MPTRTTLSSQPVLSSCKLLLLLAAALWMSAAHADDYADVNRLTGAKEFTQALAKADAYLTTKPRDPQMLFLKGVVQTQAGKADEAIATFTQLSGDYPELPEPYNNLAVVYAGQGQLDKARTALEMAIRLKPTYATAHENLGDVYARLASQSYNRALQQDAGNPALRPKLTLMRQLLEPTKAP